MVLSPPKVTVTVVTLPPNVPSDQISCTSRGAQRCLAWLSLSLTVAYGGGGGSVSLQEITAMSDVSGALGVRMAWA